VDDEKASTVLFIRTMEYAVMKAAQPIGTTLRWDVDLKEDGVKEADVEKYYRTIDTDKPFILL
jgi:hypothetical protein